MALAMAGLVAPVRADDGRRTRIVLNEIATREVEQDTVAAELFVRAASESGQESQALVDTAIKAALEKVDATSGITHLARSGYRVFQEPEADDSAGAWVAERDLTIKAREIIVVLQLVSRLQADGLILRKLGYELSAEGRRAAENELAAESIEALRARGQKIAEGVGMRVDSIENLRVTGAGPVNGRPVQPDDQARPAGAEPELLPIALPNHEAVSVTVDVEVSLIGP
jgi:predicted secreted protein